MSANGQWHDCVNDAQMAHVVQLSPLHQYECMSTSMWAPWERTNGCYIPYENVLIQTSIPKRVTSQQQQNHENGADESRGWVTTVPCVT